MADEPESAEPETEQPAPPQPPVDDGLSQWANLVQPALASQPGVEIVAKAGSSIHFRFRGQEFVVHIHRIS